MLTDLERRIHEQLPVGSSEQKVRAFAKSENMRVFDFPTDNIIVGKVVTKKSIFVETVLIVNFFMTSKGTLARFVIKEEHTGT